MQDQKTDKPASTTGDAYAKYITRIALGFAALGVIAALFTIAMLYSSIDSSDKARALFFTPLTLGAAGWFFGFSLAFLFAPTSYLQSPSAQKWMAFVGTKSIATARAVCAILVLMAAALFGVIGWATMSQLF